MAVGRRMETGTDSENIDEESFRGSIFNGAVAVHRVGDQTNMSSAPVVGCQVARYSSRTGRVEAVSPVVSAVVGSQMFP